MQRNQKSSINILRQCFASYSAFQKVRTKTVPENVFVMSQRAPPPYGRHIKTNNYLKTKQVSELYCIMLLC